MAQVFGQPSRNAAEQSFKHTKRLVAFGMAVIAVFGAIGGYALSAVLPFFSCLAAVVITAFAWLLIWLTAKWGTDKIDAIERPSKLKISGLIYS